MLWRIAPAVAGAVLLAIGATADPESDALAAVHLARDTIERRMAPRDEISKDDGDGKNESSGGSEPAAERNEQTTEELTEDQKHDKNLLYDGSDLIDWINDNGGFVHPNARIGLDPSGQYRGVFVKTVEEGGTKDGIEDGDIIGRIPWDLIVKPKDYSKTVFWSCEAVHEMLRQMLLGDKSKYAPYVNYLKNQPAGRLVNEWTDAGKELLQNVLDHDTFMDDENGHGLPPKRDEKDFKGVWIKECGGEDSPLARQAFYQLTSRDEDTLMVPFYDMHNHSNDLKKLNTISAKPQSKGKPFMLHAIKDIAPGEQILISYNRCHRCWSDETYKDCTSYSHYGTPQLFDIFGFVEDFPQLWEFKMDIGEDGREDWDHLVVCIEPGGSEGGYPLKVTFGDNYAEDRDAEMPIEPNIKFLGHHLARLRALEANFKGDEELRRTMPGYEWDMAWRYHEALMTAMSAAILASEFGDTAFDEEHGEDEEDSRDGSSDDSEDGLAYYSEDDSGDGLEDGWVYYSEDDTGDEGGRDEL